MQYILFVYKFAYSSVIFVVDVANQTIQKVAINDLHVVFENSFFLDSDSTPPC